MASGPITLHPRNFGVWGGTSHPGQAGIYHVAVQDVILADCRVSLYWSNVVPYASPIANGGAYFSAVWQLKRTLIVGRSSAMLGCRV